MMKLKALQWLGLVLILETGFLHYLTSQAQYETAAYLGYVSFAFALMAVVSAFGMYREWVWGWQTGLALCCFSILTFAASRITGLPGVAVQEWLDPFGLVSVSVESLFVALCLFTPWKVSGQGSAPSKNRLLRYAFPVMGLVTVAAIALFAYRWDQAVVQEYGHHVGSYDQVCKTPLTSLADFEQRYGVQISLAAVSMLDSIVDIRLKIIDPQKAAGLLKNQAAILVDQKVLILAPHQHHHGTVKRNKIHFLFFPTQAGKVYPGATVNLVFGSVRVEGLTVR